MASRMPSPSMLSARIVIVMAMPGGMIISGPWKRLSNAMRSIEPQLAVGGCTPRPRKLRPASASRQSESMIDSMTSSGERTFGKMCENMIRHVEPPTIFDASM